MKTLTLAHTVGYLPWCQYVSTSAWSHQASQKVISPSWVVRPLPPASTSGFWGWHHNRQWWPNHNPRQSPPQWRLGTLGFYFHCIWGFPVHLQCTFGFTRSAPLSDPRHFFSSIHPSVQDIHPQIQWYNNKVSLWPKMFWEQAELYGAQTWCWPVILGQIRQAIPPNHLPSKLLHCWTVECFKYSVIFLLRNPTQRVQEGCLL